MSSDAPSDPKVEIAHVLNMDVVEYSTLLITEQTRVMSELKRIVKETARFRRGEAEDKLIRVPTGDGMLLVFFDDTGAPIECAMEIAKAMKSRPQIRLRMGIHSGPVNVVVDVNERSNVAGAGVDMAQRVMDCGDAGHILLSKRIAEDLAPFPRWNPHLHDLGECEVKHGRKVSLVNFYTDDIGNPNPPKKCAAAKETLPARSTSTFADLSRLTPAWIGAAVLLLFALVLAVLVFFRQTPPPSSRPQGDGKSIAVLPFENLSQDPDNAYFADGIQEEILTRLSKIADLKVISRTSTQRYKSAPTNLFEIAKQLGVANILEGTVQKAADQVRVNVQLINAENDSHLWADKYDRKLTDIFAVESEIATKIADTLQTKLTSSEEQAIAARPTEDVDAHQLYLKGRYFWRKQNGANLEKAIDYFHQTIARDPRHAAAYAGLADCYMLLPFWKPDAPSDSLEKARAAAQKALDIDNTVAEAHVSVANVLYLADFNRSAAKRELQRALELNPNYATAHQWLAIILLPEPGEIDHAIAEFKRACELDPFSLNMNANLGYTYMLARRYPEAIMQLRKTIELDPSYYLSHRCLAQALELSGQLEQAIAEFEKPQEANDERFTLAFRAHAYAVKGDRERALQLLNQMKELAQHRNVSTYGFALAYVGLGDKNEAINWLERSYQAKHYEEISFIKVDPFLDPLRGDPRFEKLANQIIPPK
jgi:TolB-like protein